MRKIINQYNQNIRLLDLKNVKEMTKLLFQWLLFVVLLLGSSILYQIR